MSVISDLLKKGNSLTKTVSSLLPQSGNRSKDEETGMLKQQNNQKQNLSVTTEQKDNQDLVSSEYIKPLQHEVNDAFIEKLCVVPNTSSQNLLDLLRQREFCSAVYLDGDGFIIDGNEFNKDVLIKSIKRVFRMLKDYDNAHPSSRPHRQTFLMRVCSIFSLPTTIETGSEIEAEELLQKLDTKIKNYNAFTEYVNVQKEYNGKSIPAQIGTFDMDKKELSNKIGTSFDAAKPIFNVDDINAVNDDFSEELEDVENDDPHVKIGDQNVQLLKDSGNLKISSSSFNENNFDDHTSIFDSLNEADSDAGDDNEIELIQ